MLSSLISIVKRGLVAGHLGSGEDERFPAITLSEFTRHWQERIEGAQCAETLCALLRSVADALSDESPSRPRFWGAKFEQPYLRVSDWSYLELGHNAYSAVADAPPRSLRLPFPEGTGASQMLREDLLLNFPSVFLACDLLELLVSHTASLPHIERDRASTLISTSKPASPRSTFFASGSAGEHQSPLATLSVIFQLTLVHPFSTTLASDALSKCVFSWQSATTAQEGHLPPRVLLLELLQIGSKSWLVESCDFAMHALSVRWNSLKAEVDGATHTQPPVSVSCETLPVPVSGRAPSSSAESAETLSAKDPYRVLSTSLDSQKNHLDLSQQLLNLAVLYCWLKGAREVAQDAHERKLRDVNEAWNEKLKKSIDRLAVSDESNTDIPEELQTRVLKLQEEEGILGQQLCDLNDKKQKIATDREQKEKQIHELRLQLEKLEKESTQLREEEMAMASQICELSEAMEAVEYKWKKEQADCHGAIERKRSALEDLNSINSFIGAAQASGLGSAPTNQPDSIEEAFGEYASNFVKCTLPSLLATQKQFIEFCCQRIAQRKPPAIMAADMVNRSTQGRSDPESYRINLYRPVLAQSITNMDRIVHSANVGVNALKDLPLGDLTLETSAMIEAYQSCRTLVADNYALIYQRDPT